MRSFLGILSFAPVLMLMISTASAQSDRKREIVADGDVRIEVIAEGAGPLVVILPSRGREFLQDTKEHVSEALQAGQEAIRPAPTTR